MENGSQKFKEFIDLYMNSKYARPQYLPSDTERGLKAEFSIVEKYMNLVSTEVGEINNFKHLRGAATRLLAFSCGCPFLKLNQSSIGFLRCCLWGSEWRWVCWRRYQIAPKEISLYAISQVIRARVEDIIQKVDFEIVVSGIRNKLAGGIVLTGGGSSMKDITQLFNYFIGLEVHIGSPGQRLGKGMIDEVRNPMYATSIGLHRCEEIQFVVRFSEIEGRSSPIAISRNSCTISNTKWARSFFTVLLKDKFV